MTCNTWCQIQYCRCIKWLNDDIEITHHINFWYGADTWYEHGYSNLHWTPCRVTESLSSIRYSFLSPVFEPVNYFREIHRTPQRLLWIQRYGRTFEFNLSTSWGSVPCPQCRRNSQNSHRTSPGSVCGRDHSFLTGICARKCQQMRWTQMDWLQNCSTFNGHVAMSTTWRIEVTFRQTMFVIEGTSGEDVVRCSAILHGRCKRACPAWPCFSIIAKHHVI